MKRKFEELTTAEKASIAKRRKFVVDFFKVYPACFIVTGLLTLFAIYMTGDFYGAFTAAYAPATAGIFMFNALVVAFLVAITNTSANGGQFQARNSAMSFSVMTMAYLLCLATARYFSIFCLPICLVSLVLVELSNRRTSTITSLALSAMLFAAFVYGADAVYSTLPAIVIAVVGNLSAAVAVNLLVDAHLTRLKFILSAFGATAICMPIVLIGTLVMGDTSINLLLNVVWAYAGTAGSVMVFTPIIAILEAIFNVADDFRLNELCNLNQPLLKRLASEAPGTFNHSLVVGNLSEACAKAIGENPNLARAAAYYHDIGKLKAPIYFSENQSTYNPHDELIPEVSVSMITSHTVFGEILAKQYRLPAEIVAVCKEHHGTSPVGYFYRKALNLTEDEALSTDNYTYPGPKPQSKISAIIMIADTVEAACRSYMPNTPEEFAARVNKLVDEKLQLGQFDECPITMKDISIIKTTIIETLPRVQHGRVSYEKRRA